MGALETLRRRERTIARFRWAVVAVAGVQIAAGLVPDAVGASAVIGLLVLAGCLAAAGGRLRTVDAGRRLAVTVMSVDVVAAAVHVLAGTTGSTGVTWGALVLLSLEGALRRRLAGAVMASVGAAVGYAGIELWAGSTPFADVAGRVALLLLIGVFAGAIAREFDTERLLFQQMAAASQDVTGQRDDGTMLHVLADHVGRTLGAAATTVLTLRDGRWREVGAPDGAPDPVPPPAEARSQTTWRPGAGAASGRLTLPVRLPDRPADHVLVAEVHGPRPRGLTEGALLSLAEAAAVSLRTLEVLRDQEATTRRLERLEALRTRFVATVAHDLRSPLTTVKGVASILRDRRDAVPPERVDAMLASVERQADRLNRLADDLLDAARLDTDQLLLAVDDVDVRAILADVAADDDLDVQLDLEGSLALRGDAARLERVVWNLVTNARKYGRPPVVVTARSDEDGGLRLVVRDHGPGLSAGQRGRLFADFAAGEDPGSVGLGLAIVWQLVAAHGGDVTYADARPGASFTIALPAGPPDPPPHPENPATHDASRPEVTT